MRRAFIGSLVTLGVMFIIASISVGIGVATAEGSLLNSVAAGTFITMLCSSPLVFLVALVSGIATLVERLKGKQKRKRVYENFDFNEDIELDDIMARLTPDQQNYLQEQLRSNRLGLGNDGELMSMNELLNNFEEKEKRM